MSHLRQFYIHIFLIFSALLFSISSFAQKNDVDNLKEEALSLFESKKYSEAKDRYAQLVSLYPKDENYNYHFGACMLYVDVDKANPLKFLEYAVSRPNVDIEAFYYLGKGYHYNYRFDDAISYFEKYKSKLPPKIKSKFDVDQDIRYCENGKNLLTNVTDPFVIQKKKVNQSDFFISFKLADIDGRVLVAPTELQTATDKKNNYVPKMYTTKKSNIIYYTSYGSNDKNGIDIYSITINNSGEFGKPIRLPETINTEYDEGFPFMTLDRTKFYFSSKGHNSMGGFDLFSSDYDTLTNNFGKAKNLDYSINTPDDDLMYAEIGSEGVAFFSSTRNCEQGKAYVYKIDSKREMYQVAVLAGTFDSDETRTSKITVEDLDKHIVFETYHTNKKSGEYVMRLKNGGKYKFLIEPHGSDVIYQGRVDLPDLAEPKLLKQEIEILVDEAGNRRLVIKNLFEEEVADSDADIIAKSFSNNADIKENQIPELTISTTEMVSEIKLDKVNLENQAGESVKKVAVSYALANDKRELAQKNLDMAESLESRMSINDDSETSKKNESELTQLLADAKTNSLQAETLFNLAGKLEKKVEETNSSINKTESYLVQLNQASTSDNQLLATDIYTKYTSNKSDFVSETVDDKIDNDIKEAEFKMNSYMGRVVAIEEEQSSIKSEISNNKALIKSTRKKKDKETYQSIIDELEIELSNLDTEKIEVFDKAGKQEKVVLQLRNELVAVKSVNETSKNSQVFEPVSAEEKSALIASIGATTNEIDALESHSYSKIKTNVTDSTIDNSTKILEQEAIVENEVDNSDFIDSTEEELAELANDTIQPGNEVATNVKPNDNNEVQVKANSDAEYFAYTTEYESESDNVILVEGKSVPLDITSNTGKLKYTEEELSSATVTLSTSSYHSEFKNQTETNKVEENKLIKSEKSQSINYNWLVDIEREVAELKYAKSNSTNSAYNSRIDQKVAELNSQAVQKRNFLALNAQILKQLKSEEETELANNDSDNIEVIETEVLNEEIIAENEVVEVAEATEELKGDNNLEVDPQENLSVNENEEVAQVQVPVTTSDSLVSNSEENPIETNTNEVAETQDNVDDNSVKEEVNPAEEEPSKVTPINKVSMTATETVLAEVEVRKTQQAIVIESKSTNISSLENEIEGTRKKKKRKVLEADLEVSKKELALENEKLILIQQQSTEIISSQDELIEDPLQIRLSKAKYYEAAVLTNKIGSLNNDIEDLKVQLEQTKRKKKKRVIEAEIQNVQNELAITKMKKEVTLQTAKEMEEVEISTLKRLTKYGTEELVKIPEPSRELTTEELDQLKEEIEYVQFVQSRRDFDKVIESANVFYQSGLEKTSEVKALEEEITLLNEGMELLPIEDQDSLRMLIVEKKTTQKKIMAEAEVYYKAGKELTNDAYFGLNEANSELLTLDDANKRSMIISAWNGYVKPVIVESDTVKIDSNNIDVIPSNLGQDIFVASDATFYSEQKPIPVDVKLPSGLILKVQIGAFRNPIPQETFKGFAPIVGERTNSGLTRYTAGLFMDFETANAAKDGIRSKGYSDAFVVAYLNGERVSISEARKIISGELAATDVKSQTQSSSTPVRNDVSINIETINSAPINNGQQIEVFEAGNRGELYFTVQVGVYSSRINPSSVLNISPLNFEEIQNNLIRFSSGVYGSVNEAISAKNKIVTNGISDAFVTAYHNGSRVTIAEAKRLANGSSSANVTTAQNPSQTNPITQNQSFYVSVGPYVGSIPIDQARVILTLNSVGVVVEKNNNATLYKIGNFTNRSEAEAMKTGLEEKGFNNPTIVEVEK